MTTWESLHRRERNYITTCIATPSTWNLGRKLGFARTTVAQLWQDTTVMMAASAKAAGNRFSSAMVTYSPTRGVSWANFLAKLQSLVFQSGRMAGCVGAAAIDFGV